MAYEMKPDDFNLTLGDKAINIKGKSKEGKEYNYSVFTKKLSWGLSFSGKMTSLKKVYLSFIEFTVKAVKHYWFEEDKKEEDPNKSVYQPKPTAKNESADSFIR